MSTPPSLTDTMYELIAGINSVIYGVSSAITGFSHDLAQDVVSDYVGIEFLDKSTEIFNGVRRMLTRLFYMA